MRAQPMRQLRRNRTLWKMEAASENAIDAPKQRE
jgi:hypothetical protein